MYLLVYQRNSPSTILFIVETSFDIPASYNAMGFTVWQDYNKTAMLSFFYLLKGPRTHSKNSINALEATDKI